MTEYGKKVQTAKTSTTKSRCPWAEGNALMQQYHDNEWGLPVHDEHHHFEMLILEGAQAGLNWQTILNKRENYRKLFKNFDPVKVAKMTDSELEKCLRNDGIIRNRLKVYAARKNAIAFLAIQKEFASFDQYIWQFVNGKPIISKRKTVHDIPAETEISKIISKDLKKRGMIFVGPTIVYAYMQAVGLVNDHLTSCPRHNF